MSHSGVPDCHVDARWGICGRREPPWFGTEAHMRRPKGLPGARATSRARRRRRCFASLTTPSADALQQPVQTMASRGVGARLRTASPIQAENPKLRAKRFAPFVDCMRYPSLHVVPVIASEAKQSAYRDELYGSIASSLRSSQ